MSYSTREKFDGEISSTLTIDGVAMSLLDEHLEGVGETRQFVTIDGLLVGKLCLKVHGRKVKSSTIFFTYMNGYISTIKVDGWKPEYLLDMYRIENKHLG